MNINKIQNNTNFKSGLTKEIIQMEKKVQPGRIKTSLYNSSYRDWQDFYTLEFKKNKAHALASKLCTDIFIKFREKHDYRKNLSMMDMVLPHGLYVFDEDELQNPFPNGEHYHFVIRYSDKNILKNKKYFDRQTIFLNNIFGSLEDINERMDIIKRKNSASTGHFLHCHIHEWIHAIQGKLLHHLTADGFSSIGNYKNTYNYYGTQNLSEKENEIVADVLGLYAAKQDSSTSQYSEIFAEAWTKFICNSLNKECTGFKKDPISELKKTPKEFKEIMKKVSTIIPINEWGESESVKPFVSWNNKWDTKDSKKIFFSL